MEKLTTPGSMAGRARVIQPGKTATLLVAFTKSNAGRHG